MTIESNDQEGQANQAPEAQDEQLTAPESTSGKEEGDLTIPTFNNADEEDKFYKALLKQKRKANAQAQAEREAKEELEKRLKTMAEEQEKREQAALEELQAKLEAREQELNDARNELETRKAKEAQLRFDHAAEKHEVEDTDFVQYKLNSHLSSLDDEGLQSFSIDEFMQGLKEKHTVAFKSKAAKETKMASTGSKPETAGMPSYQASASTNKPNPNRKQTKSEWEAYKAQKFAGA